MNRYSMGLGAELLSEVRQITDSWACCLQRFSAPWLDALVYYITNLGSEAFAIVALPGLYWLWNKRSGYRIGVAYLGSVYLNSVLKVAFHSPRPVPTDCARVMHPETGPGYSFPSGHAQNSTVFWGQASIQARRRAVLIASIVLVALISLSRIYLNVHWPIDVAGGILVGAVILRAFNILALGWENLRPPTWLRVGMSVAVPVTMALLYNADDNRIVLGLLIGVSLGSVVEERRVRWREHATFTKQVLKFALGMAGLLGLRYGLKVAFPQGAFWDIFRYSIVGTWVSLGAPYLFVRFGWYD